MTEPRRICSLLPSATEIVYALGLGDHLVAVTHECDHPPDASRKPRVTRSVIDSDGLSAGQIDRAVRESLAEQATIYHLDRNLLESLQPDLILTQDLCDVCAVGSSEVSEVVQWLSFRPEMVSLEPETLDEVLDSILLVGCKAGALSRAIDVVEGLRVRLEDVRRAVGDRESVRVLTLEWTEPPFAGGHWVPEMVEIAGGTDVLGQAGEPSREVSWDEVLSSGPDVIVAMPCGFGLERSIHELRQVDFPKPWYDLPAVRANRVYVVDGSSYFNRPGPRLIDGVEILANILHPSVRLSTPEGSFAHFSLETSGTPV